MNGTLSLNLTKKKYYTVIGGPYRERIPGTVGVKMAAELNHACDINIPTPDFSVPKDWDMNNGLINAVRAITQGKPVYVGCMAGRGRTGLFLAILAKAMGEPDPVQYVRDYYYSHAVETQGQMDYVKNYPIPKEVTKMLRTAKFKSFFSFKKSLTNLDGVVL